MCHPRTMQRARQIASNKRNILTKQVRYDGNTVTLSAFVASSSGWSDRYRTSVSFNDKDNYIDDYSCTCPAYREFNGMCKHSVALTLDYLSDPASFMGYIPNHTSKTSACISEFMKRTHASNNAHTNKQISLQPTLVYSYRNWSVKFRVGNIDTSYVVKSISDLAGHVRNSEFASYGKKLAFTHTPNNFTERSRKLIAFIEEAVSLRQMNTPTFYGHSFTSSTEVGRSMELTESEVVSLLDAMGSGPIAIESTGMGRRALTHAQILDEDPVVTLTLKPAGDGGFYLDRSVPVTSIARADQMYAWVGESIYRCTPKFAQCADFLKSVYDSDDDGLYISNEDMPLFCATALENVEQFIKFDLPSNIDDYRPVPCKLEFYFDKSNKCVTLSAEACYGKRRFKAGSDDELAEGGKNVHKDTPSDAPIPLRDDALESEAETLARKYFGADTEALPLTNEEAIAKLLFGGLEEFRQLGTVFTTPAFDRLIREGKPRITMGVSLAGNLINLEIQSSDLPAGELSQILASYRQHKKFHRLKNGTYLDIAHAQFDQLERLASDLGISAAELNAGHAELPSFRAFYLDEESDITRDRSFKRYIENFKSVNEAHYTVPAKLKSILRPYQIDGYRWLSARCEAGFGGILADEMGLGKSLQLIALLLANKRKARSIAPSLIVCPASLVYNWAEEFARFAPELNIRTISGSKAERERSRQEAFDTNSQVDVLVTSYDLLRVDAKAWSEKQFWCFAIDEAQYIKNPATLTSRAVKRISATHRFALTGTPMENRLSELWSIFDFLMPGLLGPYASFKERFEIPIVGGDEDAAKRLQTIVGPFMLRRLKADVLKDLPDKLESAIFVPMGSEQKKLYDAHEQKLRQDLTIQHAERKQRARKVAQGEDVTVVEVLAELTKLRQLCCDPQLVYENYKGGSAKLDAILDLVLAANDAGEKVLVFSQFTSFLARISQRLLAAEIDHYTITGATPKQKRVALVNMFNEDSTPAFLISLKAGGTGLNLTGASVVIHADPWWNAAAQNQATDRAHRIGQTKVVSVQKVIAKGTIEERILKLQEAKSELAAQVVGASGVSLASLSAEDLFELLND